MLPTYYNPLFLCRFFPRPASPGLFTFCVRTHDGVRTQKEISRSAARNLDGRPREKPQLSESAGSLKRAPMTYFIRTTASRNNDTGGTSRDSFSEVSGKAGVC